MENTMAINYVSSDGLNLYAREYTSNKTANNPNKKVLLCIPGLTRNSLDYQSFSEPFRDEYRVIAVDLRGRGNSEYDSNKVNYQPVIYARDIVELIDHLNLSDVTLVGTSLGGIVSILVSNIIPDLIESIVLNDVGPEINPVGLERIRNYVGKSTIVDSWEEAVRQNKLINELELPDLSEQEWLTFTRGLYRVSTNGKIELAYDPEISESIKVKDENTPLIHLWPQFDVINDKPILVIRGEFSDILDVECVERMKSVNAQLTYCEITNRGHAPLLNEPQCVTALQSFFASHQKINAIKSAN